MSRKRVDMVDRSFIHATSIPGYLPSFVTLEGFKKEVDLRDCLQRIATEIDSLKGKIDDTILQVGSEAYRSARLFYKTVKAAAREGAEDAERIAKDLSYHYKKTTTSENNHNTYRTVKGMPGPIDGARLPSIAPLFSSFQSTGPDTGVFIYCLPYRGQVILSLSYYILRAC